MATEISSSASKALAIFTAICELGTPCSLAEIVRMMGYPRSVTGRMVATLMQHGFLMRKDDSGLYTVNPQVLHLSQKALQSDPLLSRVDVIMHEVCKRTGDTALFMIESGLQALVLRRSEGTAPVRILGSRLGMALPLHCGGAPTALLAFSSDEVIDAYLAGPLERRTENTLTDPEAVRRNLLETRQRGYSIGHEDLFEYVVAIGAPIYDDQNRLAGAISIGNIPQRYPPERIEEVGRILIEEIKRS
ncbi:IclR family transcriptional regulator [Roseovarius aestuarii]|nr:IclR family transcriptional regulator [Roseovarius aestuarii]